MSLVRRALLIIAVIAVASPRVAQAQASAAKKIPSGTYSIVANPNFSAEVDVTAFTIRFEGDSSMVTEQNGTVFIRSKLTYVGEELTWVDTEGQLSCPGTSRYKVAIDAANGDVRLTPVEDSCAERSGVLSQVKLVKMK
ncbi:MAG: hypothetical protein ABIT38_06270 [Gemmatimonadaceae bacterium]